MILRGIELTAGRELLRDAGTFWWRGRSMVMLSGCRGIADLRFQATSSATTPVNARGGVFGFEHDDALYDWAERAGARVLLPRLDVVNAAGDKRHLGRIAADAGAVTPDACVVPQAHPSLATPLWDAFAGRALVVQLPQNDLTGRGTRPVDSCDELTNTLTAWAGHSVKVAELVQGTNITLSGCVGTEITYISGISHQLVGVAGVTDAWGAHCGNQLCPPRTLSAETERTCARLCEGIGDALRRKNFLGMFGVDAIVTPAGTVVLIEINPRVQSVTSLLNFVEREHGVLPTPGAHLLTYVAPGRPPVLEVEVVQRPLSQLVITARRAGRVEAALGGGRYRLSDADELVSLPPDEDAAPSGDDAVIWAFANGGECVSPGDRLCVAMFAFPVAPVSEGRPALHEKARRWESRLTASYRITSDAMRS